MSCPSTDTGEQCAICLDVMRDVERQCNESTWRAQHALDQWPDNSDIGLNYSNPMDMIRDPLSPRNRRHEDSQVAASIQQQRLHVLGCGHTFHRSCVQPWLQNKRYCPVCKAPAEAIEPGFSDGLCIGTSFQAPFVPRTPPLAANPWPSSGQIDTHYILAASSGSGSRFYSS